MTISLSFRPNKPNRECEDVSVIVIESRRLKLSGLKIIIKKTTTTTKNFVAVKVKQRCEEKGKKMLQN